MTGSAVERFTPGTERGRLIEVEHLARYAWAARLAAGGRVLDAGCGAGYGSAMLARAGAGSVTGVDVSPDAIEQARASAPAEVELRVGDIRSLPLPDRCIDLAVCFEAIEHVEGPERALDELARVLDAGGLLAISSPNHEAYVQGNPFHVHEFEPEELRVALKARFAHVALWRQHDFSASAILDDEGLADRSAATRDGLIAKLAGQRPGRETYTLALASDAPLPAVAPLAVLTDTVEVREWIEELDRHRDAIAQAAREIPELRAIVATQSRELEQLRWRLEQADVISHIYEKMQHSLSWRITAPLRAVKRLARRS